MTLRVVDYEPGRKSAWDQFVDRSKNGTFLFKRDFMDYHADRFIDASLLILGQRDELIAMLPASRHEGPDSAQISSHGGLTYGGFICNERMSAALMLEVFENTIEHYTGSGITEILYKPVPHIYHTLAAEEDLYALFRHNARLVRRDVAAARRRGSSAPLTKGRKLSIRRGEMNEIQVGESQDWERFMEMETALLLEKFGTRPVHSATEMSLLQDRFPDRIRLFTAMSEGELLAGAVIFDCLPCAHVQYISSTARGRELCALDVLFNRLIGSEFHQHRWFDFGISTENAGLTLNSGLAANKESWGAKSVVYDQYLISI